MPVDTCVGTGQPERPCGLSSARLCKRCASCLLNEALLALAVPRASGACSKTSPAGVDRRSLRAERSDARCPMRPHRNSRRPHRPLLLTDGPRSKGRVSLVVSTGLRPSVIGRKEHELACQVKVAGASDAGASWPKHVELKEG
jgi:hypothetical protein